MGSMEPSRSRRWSILLTFEKLTQLEVARWRVYRSSRLNWLGPPLPAASLLASVATAL